MNSTNDQIHAAMLEHMKQQILEPVRCDRVAPKLVDYWCRDCRDYFRAPHNPDMHAKGQPCPRGHVFNTYQAWTE